MQLNELALSLEAASVIVIGFWRRRIKLREALLVVASCIFFISLPLLMNGSPMSAGSAFELSEIRDSWLAMYRSSIAAGLTLSTVLTARNIIAIVVLAGANVPSQQYYYGLEALGKFLDPLSFIVYTSMHLSQVMLAIFNTIVEVVRISAYCGQCIMALSLPLIIIGKTRSFGLSLLIIAVVMGFVASTAAASVYGLKPPSMRFPAQLPSSPMDLLYATGYSGWLITGYVGRQGFALITPTSASPVPSGELAVNGTYYLWLNIRVSPAINQSNGVYEIEVGPPPFHVIRNDSYAVGAWMWLNSSPPSRYYIQNGNGYTELKWTERLAPNETVENTLWTYSRNVSIKGCNYTTSTRAIYEEANLGRYIAELARLYDYIARQLGVDSISEPPRPAPPSDLTQRVVTITCSNEGNEDLTYSISAVIYGTGLGGWGDWGIGPKMIGIAYTSELMSYYDAVNSDYLVSAINEIKALPNIFGVFVVRIIVLSAIIFGAANALAFILGLPTGFNSLMYALINGIVYELSVIFLFKPSYGSTSIARRVAKKITGSSLMVPGTRKSSLLMSRARKGELHQYVPRYMLRRRIVDATTLTLIHDGLTSRVKRTPKVEAGTIGETTARYIAWAMRKRGPSGVRFTNDVYSYKYLTQSSIAVLRSDKLLARFIRYSIALRISELHERDIYLLHSASLAKSGNARAMEELRKAGVVVNGTIDAVKINRIKEDLARRYNWLGDLYSGKALAKSPRDPVLRELVSDYVAIHRRRTATVLQMSVRLKVTPLTAVMLSLGPRSIKVSRSGQHDEHHDKLVNGDAVRDYVAMGREAARVFLRRSRTMEDDLLSDARFSSLYVKPAINFLESYRSYLVGALNDMGLPGSTVHQFIIELRTGPVGDAEKAVELISELRRVDQMIKSLRPRKRSHG